MSASDIPAHSLPRHVHHWSGPSMKGSQLTTEPSCKKALIVHLWSHHYVKAIYLVLLGCVSFHAYRTPIYSFDALQYMGNAVLMEETDPVKVHDRVYSEINDRIPRIARQNMLGHELGAPEDQNKSLQERATNPYHYAEFLPCFAIRPMYNMSLYWLGKTGLGFLIAGIVLSAVSHFLLGILLFHWLTKYVAQWHGLCIALLAMITPPIMSLGRENTPDGMASLIAFFALFLIFQKQRLFPGLALLLSSIYFRTDFVVLAGPVLLALWLQKRIHLWKAAVLSVMAVASVLTINHFGGDYGIKMLYYRNFMGVPSAPGEMVVKFSVGDFLGAFRSGITLAANSFLIPFLLLGTIGFCFESRLRVVALVAMAYVTLHFVILPNWDERWFGVFYLSMTACAATVSSDKVMAA
jgi:hypothetical protein